MTKPLTQGERLIKIETLLEAKAAADGKRDEALLSAIVELKEDLKALRKDADKHKSDFDKLRSKGGGILIGVSLAAGGIGAGFGHFWQWLSKLAGG